MKVPKVVRGILVSIVVLAVSLVGIGAAYTYFLGPDAGESAVAPPPPPPTAADTEPSKPAANAAVSASVQSISSPVAPGENTSLTIRSLRGATCKAAVTYGTVTSTDSGLRPKIADEFGIVSWTWTVDETAPVGTWPVKATCEYNGRSAAVQADLQVQAAASTE